MLRRLRNGVLGLALMCACGGGDDDGGSGGADAGGVDDGCDEAARLPEGWRPVDAVSAGAVDSTALGDVTESIIDASAGGFGASETEPYVYVAFAVDLDKIAIDDVAAFDDASWDLAFKRYVIRANGGDSGPGGVSVAEVAAAALEDVTAAPGDGAFGVDRWTDESCNPVSDGIGGPRTQFSEWYDIADMILTPKPLVYVVRRPGAADVAIEIADYYADEGDPDKSGVYRVRWAPL